MFIRMLSGTRLPTLRSLLFADVERGDFASVAIPEHLAPLASLPALCSIKVASTLPFKTNISPLVSGISWSRSFQNDTFTLDGLRIMVRPRVVHEPGIIDNAYIELMRSARHLSCHYGFDESVNSSTVAVAAALGLRNIDGPATSPPPAAHTLTLHTMSPKFDLVANDLLGFEVPVPAAVEELVIVTFLPDTRSHWELWDAHLARVLEPQHRGGTDSALRSLRVRFNPSQSIRMENFVEDEAAEDEVQDPTTPREMSPSSYESLLPNCKQRSAARSVKFTVETLFDTKSWYCTAKG